MTIWNLIRVVQEENWDDEMDLASWSYLSQRAGESNERWAARTGIGDDDLKRFSAFASSLAQEKFGVEKIAVHGCVLVIELDNPFSLISEIETIKRNVEAQHGLFSAGNVPGESIFSIPVQAPSGASSMVRGMTKSEGLQIKIEAIDVPIDCNDFLKLLKFGIVAPATPAPPAEAPPAETTQTTTPPSPPAPSGTSVPGANVLGTPISTARAPTLGSTASKLFSNPWAIPAVVGAVVVIGGILLISRKRKPTKRKK